jgi:hypothetical protein
MPPEACLPATSHSTTAHHTTPHPAAHPPHVRSLLVHALLLVQPRAHEVPPQDGAPHEQLLIGGGADAVARRQLGQQALEVLAVLGRVLGGSGGGGARGLVLCAASCGCQPQPHSCWVELAGRPGQGPQPGPTAGPHSRPHSRPHSSCSPHQSVVEDPAALVQPQPRQLLAAGAAGGRHARQALHHLGEVAQVEGVVRLGGSGQELRAGAAVRLYRGRHQRAAQRAHVGGEAVLGRGWEEGCWCAGGAPALGAAGLAGDLHACASRCGAR